MRLLLVFMLISSFAFAQKSEQQLAYQYYINGEYTKAITIYEELAAERFSVAYYIPYFASLLKTEDYKSAEKLARKLAKIYPKSLNYQLEVGIVQEKSGNQKKANYTYNKVLKQLTGQQSQTINLANTFMRYDLYDAALKVYLQSEKINPKASFGTQKAQLYAHLNKVDLMIAEYLNELKRNPRQKQMVIAKVQLFLNNDGIKSEANYQLVKKQLLSFVREERGRTDFSEMLIWLFMQNAQYKMVLIQAKALDKRTNADGEQVYDLAESFLDKKEYQLAVQAYDYVLEKGKRNHLFVDANINKLYALTKSLSEQQKELNVLDATYAEVISDLGKNRNTVLLLSNYAHFKAFYLHDLSSAEQILNEAMALPQISNTDLAECKLEYADVMLLVGNIWESLLYYSQVEKDFKENPIGHQAKLRRAKIAYYQGDFDWAQAQLGTLKASTSKLIANDAMQLSLLIIDNLNLDTSFIAMRTFASADLLNYQQKYVEAIAKYDSILTAFPGHTLSDEIYMRKAEIYIQLNNTDLAIQMYQKITSDWGYDILADDALYRLAKIYDNTLADKVKAMELYEKILLEHNSSIFTAEARKRFRILRGDNLNQEE
ncbi:MAG TPA: tetratricopeptide repeat protein [Flavobacteriales bacterium]|nr:tetratricopeptide repeat protein [Flavobacteriales bacterium]HIK63351.1 tetratricopeptide repeat protein [Flavobacteriales bacterium]